MLQTTTITQKGQVTIPAYYRQQLGLQVGQKVRFWLRDNASDELSLKPIPEFTSLKGILKSNKKYSKKKARAAISRDIAAGKKL